MSEMSLKPDDEVVVVLPYDDVVELAAYATKSGRLDIVEKLRLAVVHHDV